MIFWSLVLYLVGALGFGYGATASISSTLTVDPTMTVEEFQVGLSWPWSVVQAFAGRPSWVLRRTKWDRQSEIRESREVATKHCPHSARLLPQSGDNLRMLHQVHHGHQEIQTGELAKDVQTT